MGRIAGVPNKLTTEVKEKLQTFVEGVADTLDITEMTIDQKIKPIRVKKIFQPTPRNNVCIVLHMLSN